ncbi:MAG: HAMP domain-containing sensor histidine kinase [Parvibaculales bacterium]
MRVRLSLKVQIIAVTALAMLCLQITTVALLLDERYFISQVQQVDDALYRFTTIAVTLEETPDYLHDSVIQANSDNQQILSLNAGPKLTAADDSGWAAAFEDSYFDNLERTDFSISAPIIALDQVTGTSANQSGKSWTQNVISIEAQLSQGNFLYAQFIRPPLSITLQGRLLGLLVLGLLAIAGISLVITMALTRPLEKLTQAANSFGRGQKVNLLRERGASDIRQAAAAFNQMQKQLVEALQSQQHMLAAIGHDLRTPLTSLRVRAETLPNSPQRDKIIAKMDDLAAMLEAILGFAKLHSDPSALTKQPTYLASMLTALCNDYQMAKQKCALTIMCEPPKLDVDGLHLRRAIGNIIDNGLFFGSNVSVCLDRSSSHAIIRIEDDGPGVKADKLAQLTKPFFRTEASRNSDSGGIGMGLALAQQVIGLHHGDLQFENMPGGFRVTVMLPLS